MKFLNKYLILNIDESDPIIPHNIYYYVYHKPFRKFKALINNEYGYLIRRGDVVYAVVFRFNHEIDIALKPDKEGIFYEP